MEPLIGYIEYHLNLGDDSLNWGCSTTSHPEKGNSKNELFLKAGQKRPRSPLESIRPKNGFSFVTDGLSHGNDSFQLILPQPLVQIAINSIILHSQVRLTSYIIVSNGETKSIEVSLNGLDINGDHLNNGNCQNSIHSDVPLTLHKVQQLKEIKAKSIKISIRARVDAVSPIITFDPREPFVMIEVYDADIDPSLTSTIVLRSKSLLVHSGILPGMDLILQNLRIKRWQIPQMFQSYNMPLRLYNRAPTHVFIVENPNQVQFMGNWDALTSIDALKYFPFPSITIPLTCIQGKINYIQKSERSDLERIHYVILESESKIRMKLFLTYYPLSPHTCDGFHIGAILRAMNVHKFKSNHVNHNKNIPHPAYDCFGACLRSTVTIIVGRCEGHSKLEFPFKSMSYQSMLWKQIRKTYHEYEWMSCARKILSSSVISATKIESVLESIIPHLKPIHTLQTLRNPYFEWFDHVCEHPNDNLKNLQTCNCMCEVHRDNHCYLPSVISLSRIKMACLDHTSRALRKYLIGDSSTNQSNRYSTKADRADIGWTASFHLEAGELASRICGDDNSHVSQILVGGVVYIETSSERQHLLCDGKCALILSHFEHGAPSNFQKTQNESLAVSNNDFVCILFSNVYTSCIYLGKYPKTNIYYDESNDHASAFYHLPTAHEIKSFSAEGPSNIIQIDNNFFLVSTIIQYTAKNIFTISDQRNRDNKKSKGDISLERIVMKDDRMSEVDGYELGRLIRQRWKVQKIRTSYLGCCLTVGVVPKTFEKSNPCHLPACIEITLNILLEGKNIQNHFQILHVVLPIEILQLAFAWQYVAESRLCAIVLGGWDENIKNHRVESNDEHLLYIPLRKFQGVYQLSLDISDVYTRTIKHGSLTWVAKRDDLSNLPFSYFGGRNIYPGVIDLIIRRRIISRKGSSMRYGEAIVPHESIYGLKVACISQLQFERLNGASCKNFLFKIPNAHLSVLRYCRARAECSLCHSALESSRENKRKRFWDIPVVMNSADQFSSESTIHRKLACPSGCISRYGYIKWELSASLSDGSGSMRIFTERDTSCLLLGHGLDFDVIEAGAWQTPGGIQFQLGSKLNLDIRLELARARHHISRHGLDVKPESLLSAANRAQYLLHSYCSNSHEITRRMDFVCQIKKYYANLTHPRSYDIPIISSIGDDGVIESSIDSNFIPIYDLVLVDCFRSYESVPDYTRKILESLKTS